MNIEPNNEETLSGEDKQLQDKLAQDVQEAQKMSQGFVDAEPKKPEDTTPEGAEDGVKGDKETTPEKKEVEVPKPTDDDDEDDEEEEDDDEDESPESDDFSGDDDEDDEDPSPKTPKTYIPVSQYRDLKKKYNDLQKIMKGNGSKASTDVKLQEYADKHGLEVESVKELMGLMKEDLVSEEDFQVIQIAAENARMELEKTTFEKEWSSDAVPAIEKLFPGATPEQLQKAREKIDKLSHTKWGHDKELGYIVFKKADELKDIFTGEPVKKGTKTAEISKPGKGNANDSVLTMESLRTSKDFSKLLELPEDERQKLVSQMDPNMYWDYGQFVTSQQNMGIEINRNGERVRLK